MTYDEWCKTKGIITYKKYCNCGAMAPLSARRKNAHPHLDWCAQYEEYEALYKQYLKETE